jgi:hypothetical protein
MPLPVVISFLRRSCCLKAWFLVPLLPSGFVRRLVPNILPFWVPCTALSLPCPWRPCPLRRAGMAQRVILLQATANFFRGPPFSWVLLFGFWRRPMARCLSPCRFFSAPKVYTAASSLGTSSCTATDFISSGFASKLVASSFLDRPPFSPAGNPSWPSFILGWHSFVFGWVDVHFGQQAFHHL